MKQRLLVVFLLFASLAIRLYHLNRPPLDFHATRQYRSFIIAREYYYETSADISDWQRQVAHFSQQKQGMLEPPILEFIVGVGYHLVGDENFWFPRLLSSLFWEVGGIFVYLIGREIADDIAALFAMAFHLFLPFGVIASRVFQPDPLMVLLLLASVFAILRYNHLPSLSRLAVAAAISALAFLVKPGSLFAIVGVFVALAISRQSARQAVLNRAFLVFIPIMITPTVLAYGYGVFSGHFLIGEAEKTLLPQLWMSTFFWRGWLANIANTVGLIPFMGGLLGVLIFRKGLPQALMLGLWTGYTVFCLALNYNLATHDYYQLQLIPIVGLSLGPIISLLVSYLMHMHPEIHWRLAMWGVFVMCLILSLADARARLVGGDFEHKVRVEQEIGELVNHSIKTIFLSGDYGVPLEYHGLLSGWPWPLASDLQWEQLNGIPPRDAEARFKDEFAKYSPDYFIIMDMAEFQQQQDLKDFLTKNFAIVAQNNDFMIFDLPPR
jgi:4-amino-4-deoxy-L-arabinose transferase-like glycosyltransferase